MEAEAEKAKQEAEAAKKRLKVNCAIGRMMNVWYSNWGHIMWPP
jgi:hypothetical protein